jgi:hypothetical protein
VADNVLAPLINGVTADNYFLSVGATREDEAVIGSIGNSDFDLFAASHRPQNFYMLDSMGVSMPARARRRAGAARTRRHRARR